MVEEDNSTELKKQMVAASVTVMSASVAVISAYKSCMKIPMAPHINRDSERIGYIDSLIHERDSVCHSELRMSISAFHELCMTLSENNLLKPTLEVSVEQQVTMFLHTLGHNVRQRTIGSRFFRSGETVSRYFDIVLRAILALKNEYLVQPRNESPTPEKILASDRYWPWFKDCIGAIDGTHVIASVPIKIQGRFRGRKEKPTQNVMAAVDFDLKFTYVLAGWEGSANDSIILDDALRRRNGLFVPEGKYYLVDGGYGIRKGFITPYRGARYHLKEYSNHEPENYKELFNLRHSSLRTTIERAFGVLKKRFRVLDAEKFWSLEKQVEVVIACCVLHDYIVGVDPNDPLLVEAMNEPIPELPTEQRERIPREERIENCEWARKRDEIASDMYNDYIRI